MTERKRNAVFPVLSAFSVLLIIYLHAFPVIDPDAKNLLVRILMRLRLGVGILPVYTFVFISGYLFSLTTPPDGKFDFRGFVGKKAKRLLLPYVFLSSVAYPVKCVLSRLAMRPSGFSAAEYFKGLVFPYENTIFFFWFLPTLFCAFLFAPVLNMALRRPARTALIPLTTALLAALYIFNPFGRDLIFNIKGIADFLFFFWAGMVFFSLGELKVPFRGAVSLLCLAAVVIMSLDGLNSRAETLAATVLFIFWIHHFAGFYVARGWKAIRFMEGYSYPVFLLSWFPIVFVRIVMYQKLHAGLLPVIAAMYVCGLVAPLVVAKAVQRYLPRAGSLIGL